MSTPSFTQQPEQRQRQLPPRIARACERCRSRKIRCDGHSPCSACRPGGHACVFRPRQARRRGRHVQRASSVSSQPQPPPALSTRPPPLQPYSSDPIQFKRQKELRTGIGISNVETGSFQFYGPSSHFCFLQRLCQRIARTTNGTLLARRTSLMADGVRKWNLERFMFTMNINRPAACHPDAYISQEMGSTLIESYFEIIHPQIPVLHRDDIVEQWESLWKPPMQQDTSKSRDILFLVLAIGARVAIAEGQHDTSVLEGWADHFACKTSGLLTSFEDPSLSSTHFLLLRAIYAYQLMRPNEAYLYLGHAARSAMALGINRQQVVDGANVTVHGLKCTFWIVYGHERACALYTGRPSAFRDDLNDAPYPEDLPSPVTADNKADRNHPDPMRLCGFIRAMADIGRVSDRVFLELYSPKNVSNSSHLIKLQDVALETETMLDSITCDLPLDLHFFDATLPLGHGWQEVQRLTLGCSYYFLRMLIHRPALLFSSFFRSREEAQSQAGEAFDLDVSVWETITAATNIINLAHDVYFKRHPRARFEGSSATLLVSACVTLLYDVLDPSTHADHAKDVLTVVERAVECLDNIHHVGHTSGKSVSLDVMRIAKDTLRSTTIDTEINQNLLSSFPWLQYLSSPDGPPLPATAAAASQDPLPSPASNTNPYEISSTLPADQPQPQSQPVHAAPMPSSEVNYMSHWLEAGFAPEDIPSCLF